MKKMICVILSLSIVLFAAGCGEASPEPVQSPAAEENIVIEETPSPEQKKVPEPPTPAAASDPVDIDLTQLSSTMVYSEVYAMVYEPEQYIGKTVKMRGLFATQVSNEKRLFACIIQDATACCAQGLEFEPVEAFAYPEDFPEPGEEITVVGTFDSYTEDVGNGNTYLYLVLRDAKLV